MTKDQKPNFALFSKYVALFIGAIFLSNCASIETKTTSALKKPLKSEYQQKVDDQILREAHQKHLAKNGGAVNDPRRTAYVKRILNKITKANKLDQHIYRVVIMKSDNINAYSLGSESKYAYIYVTQSMVDFSENEGQLASVIAHEIAHVIVGHHVERIQKGNQRHFNQNQELEADAIGAKLLKKAGYDVKDAVALLEKFNIYLKDFVIVNQADYPKTKVRIKQLQKLVKS